MPPSRAAGRGPGDGRYSTAPSLAQSIYRRLSARDNLVFAARLYSVERARVEEVLAEVGLAERANGKVEKYSNGMKQRLLIARALLHEPKVLFLDEPTRGLGLLIPPDLDRKLDSGEPVVLEGYYAWAARAHTAELQSIAEQELAALLGRPVHIDLDGHVVYPLPGAQGYQTMVSLILVLVSLVVGALIVPYLIFEEKEARTLDVLLVSPASAGQMVLGKALAGTFYCLTASAVALAFQQQWVVHWWLAILATIIGAVFAVGLGLLLGSVFENAQQMGLWAGPPFLLLILPLLVGDLPTIPAPVRTHLIPWIPTAALARALGLSFSGSVPLGQAAGALAVVAAWTGLVLVGVIAVVRRSDR